jgi:hypothetical protein
VKSTVAARQEEALLRKLKNEGALFGVVAMAMFSSVRNYYHNKPMIL